MGGRATKTWIQKVYGENPKSKKKNERPWGVEKKGKRWRKKTSQKKNGGEVEIGGCRKRGDHRIK